MKPLVAARKKHVQGLQAGEIPLRPIGVRVFVCTDHDGYHGFSSQRASVIVAKDEIHAREMLDQVLIKMKLLPFKRFRYRLEEIPLDRWTAEVLADGGL